MITERYIYNNNFQPNQIFVTIYKVTEGRTPTLKSY